MDFALSDDQRLLQGQLGGAMARLAPLARVRRHAAMAADVFAEDIWDGLAQVGVPGLLIPEEFGGLEFGLLDAALISEMLGRHVVPAPFLGPVVAAPLAIRAGGSEQQKRDLLPRIARGELRIAIALSGSMAGARPDEGVSARGGRLHGTCRFTIDTAGCEMILVEAQDGELYLVDRNDPGVEITPLVTVDQTRSAAASVFDGASSSRLDASAAVRGRIASALNVMLAADLLGAGTHMLETAVEYAKVRRQFGRPIASFQAVQHLCANVAAELEPGRALVWYAAHALDVGLPDATLCALHAKAYLADAGRIAARNTTEVHGGIGITDDLGLHYWFKRITWSGQALGGATRVRELAAAAQLQAEEAPVSKPADLERA
jgi:alkylation response protein AidB-like acyl-CoA dehydrogenase